MEQKMDFNGPHKKRMDLVEPKMDLKIDLKGTSKWTSKGPQRYLMELNGPKMDFNGPQRKKWTLLNLKQKKWTSNGPQMDLKWT